MWNKTNNKNKDRNQLKVLNGQRANKINRIKCWLKGLIKLIKSTHTVKVTRYNWNLRLFPSRGRIYVSSPKCELDFVSFLSPTEFGRCVTNYFQTSSGKAKWLLPGLRGGWLLWRKTAAMLERLHGGNPNPNPNPRTAPAELLMHAQHQLPACEESILDLQPRGLYMIDTLSDSWIPIYQQ